MGPASLDDATARRARVVATSAVTASSPRARRRGEAERGRDTVSSCAREGGRETRATYDRRPPEHLSSHYSDPPPGSGHASQPARERVLAAALPIRQYGVHARPGPDGWIDELLRPKGERRMAVTSEEIMQTVEGRTVASEFL